MADNKGGKGLWSKVKDLVVEEVPATPQVGATPKVAVSVPTSSTAPYVPATVIPGTANPEIRAKLEKAIAPAAHPALSKLQEHMGKMAAALPDPVMRLSASLALLDADQVLVDIREALDELGAQEKKAADGAQAVRQQRVGGLSSKIDANKARMAELQQELLRLDTETQQLAVEQASAAAEIDATLAGITATAAVMRQELEELRGNVQSKKGK